MRQRLFGKRLRVGSLLVLLCGMLVVGTGHAQKTFEVMTEFDVGGAGLDPGKGFSHYAMNLYLGLGRINPRNEYEPGAALSYDVSEDGKTYTFHLRTDAAWSDGTPLTAHDFEYAWKRVLDPATASTRSFMLFLLESAQAFNAGEVEADAVGVRALDDHTLEVRLVTAAPFFPLYISANNAYMPVPRHAIEQHEGDWTLPGNHVSSGPFVLESWTPNLVMTLVPNPHYPLQQPRIDRLVVHVVPQPAVALSKFENDELDFTWNLPVGEMDRLRADPVLATQLGAFTEANQTGLQFSVASPPLDDPLVRKAIAMAVDPAPIISGPLKDLVQRAESLFVPNIPGGRDGVALPYDPEQARGLLAEAGYPNGQGFPEIGIAVRSASPTALANAQSVQAMLAANLNIPVKVEGLESAAYFDRLNRGDIPLALTGPFSLTPDPYDLFNVLQGLLHNQMGWRDADWDQLLVEAAGEPDPQQRLAMYYQLEDIVVREATVFQPLYNGERHALQKPHVRNYLGWDERNLWILSHEYVDIEH